MKNPPFRSNPGGTCRKGYGGGAAHQRYRDLQDASCASRYARGPPRRAPASCGSSRNETAVQRAFIKGEREGEAARERERTVSCGGITTKRRQENATQRLLEPDRGSCGAYIRSV